MVDSIINGMKKSILIWTIALLLCYASDLATMHDSLDVLDKIIFAGTIVLAIIWIRELIKMMRK